jgi:hypothetical protein
MAKTIDDLFVYLRIITDLFLIFLILYTLRQGLNQGRALKAILIYCVYNVLFYLVTEKMSLAHMLKVILYTSYTFVEYLIFSFLLYSFIKSKSFRRVILLSSLLFVCSLISFTLFTKIEILDTVPIGIETILILIFSFYYLYEQMSDLNNQFIYNQFSFWAVTGMMIYLAGSFFIYVFAAQINTDILKNYWFLTNAFYCIKNILFGIGAYLILKKLKSPHPKELQPYLN